MSKTTPQSSLLRLGLDDDVDDSDEVEDRKNVEEDLFEGEVDNHIDDHDYGEKEDELTQWESDVHLCRKSFVCSIQLASVPAEKSIKEKDTFDEFQGINMGTLT